MSNKIAENIKKIADLDENRCAQSQLYVESLKHNKIALSLIAFIRNAIQNKDSLSLAQRNEIIHRLSIFVQMYSDHNIKAMI